MQSQDEAALAALSLVTVLLDRAGSWCGPGWRTKPAPNMPLLFGGGILGELFLANRKLASMQREGQERSLWLCDE